MRRRALLAKTTALGSITALAGCISDFTGESTTTEGTTTDATTTDTTTTTEPLSVSNKSIETTTTGCGDANEASIEFTDGGASVTGSVPASNPCHEASFVSHRVMADVVQITVGTTATDADSCQQCLAAVEYDATVETNVDPTSVVVVHKYTPQGQDEPTTEVVADAAQRD